MIKMNREIFAKVKTEEQLKVVLEDINISTVILEPEFLSEGLKAACEKDLPAAKAFEQALSDAKKSGKRLYLSLPYILRENYFPKEKTEKLTELTAAGLMFGFLIHNIDEIGLLKELGYEGEVLAGEYLYAYNRKSIEVLKEAFGNLRFISMPELTLDEMNKLQKSSGEGFIFKVYGRQILMLTAQDLVGTSSDRCMSFRNDKNENFISSFEAEDGYSIIYNSTPTYLLDKLDELTASDILLDFTVESEQDVRQILRELDDALQKNGPKPVYDSALHTRGHYLKNIF